MSMDFGLDHLMDPLTSIPGLTSILPMLQELMAQNNLQSDPNLLALINNQANEYNAVNAYVPETGQFQAGNPYGDAASGYGGAFGVDRNGNPMSPSGAFTQNALSQIQGGQGRLDQAQQNFAALAQGAGPGVVAPGGFDLGTMPGLDPGAVQGVDQSVRTPPTPLNEVQPVDNFMSRAQERMQPGGGGLFGLGLQDGLRDFLGSFAVGTTSVPQTGLAQVHQGEMIVPAQQNPQRQAPGILGQPMAAGGGQMPLPQPMALPAGSAGGPMAPPHGGGGPIALPPGSAGGPMQPAAGMGNGAPSYGALTPGLSPEVQQQLINRGTGTIDRQSEGVQRNLNTQGAVQGAGSSGALSRQLFDAELARSGAVSDLQRDVGLEAANRQFTDQLAANNFELNRYLGEGGLGVQQGQLALQGELGRGQLGQGQQRIDLERFLGEGGLGIQQGQLDLQGELGRGQLGNETFLAQLQQTLGLGQLGQGQQRIDLESLLGQGQLGIQQGRLGLDQMMGAGQLGQGQQRIDLESFLSRGQLGQGQQRIDLESLFGRMGLDNERFGLETSRSGMEGGLSNERRGQDLNQLLGLGNLGLQQGGLDFNNRAFDAEFGRGLNNDWWRMGNDVLGQQNQQFTDLLQQQYQGDQQNQFNDLMSYLAQYAGQSQPPAAGVTTGTAPQAGGTPAAPGAPGPGGGGFQPFNGFFQQLFGLN